MVQGNGRELSNSAPGKIGRGEKALHKGIADPIEEERFLRAEGDWLCKDSGVKPQSVTRFPFQGSWPHVIKLDLGNKSEYYP